jgi:hypothetical protein
VHTVLCGLTIAVTFVEESMIGAEIAKLRESDRVLLNTHLCLRIHVLVAEVNRLCLHDHVKALLTVL